MDAATINSIRRKIASLERMTVANGCTPAEAANAHQMVDRLRAKLPTEHAQSTFSQNYQQEQPNWHTIHKYWQNEYFREFRQPLRERQQRPQPNLFDELLSGLAGGGSPGRFRF